MKQFGCYRTFPRFTGRSSPLLFLKKQSEPNTRENSLTRRYTTRVKSNTQAKTVQEIKVESTRIEAAREQENKSPILSMNGTKNLQFYEHFIRRSQGPHYSNQSQ